MRIFPSSDRYFLYVLDKIKKIVTIIMMTHGVIFRLYG